MLSAIPDIFVTAVTTASFSALLAVALQVIYGSSRILNFAQGEFVVLGMFGMWLLRAQLHLNTWLAVAVLLLVGLLAGVVFCLVAARPLYGRHFFQLALGTLSVGLVIRSALAWIFGSNVKVIEPFVVGEPLRAGPFLFSYQSLVIVAGSALAIALLYCFFRFTWTGLAMRATAENREGAEVVGVDPRMVMLTAFAISGMVSALAGSLMAPVLGARFDFGLEFMLVAFVASVLGGLTSTAGATAGGFVLGFSTAFIAALVGSEYQSVWLLLVLLPLLYLRPHGVLGRVARDH